MTFRSFASALLDPALTAPPGLRTWNDSDPNTRLAVYRNNVVSSLVDALSETFPVIRQLVGEEFFRAMAAVFVRQYPPRSRVLTQYGQEFPAFLTRFEPAQSLPYLADMARLEIMRISACHAADADTVPDETVSQALSDSEHIASLEPELHPSLDTIESPYAIVSLWAAHQSETIETIHTDAPESAIILRQGLVVLVLPAPDGAVEFVRAILRGRNLGDAAADAASAAPLFDLTTTLTLLLTHGALTSLHLPDRPL